MNKTLLTLLVCISTLFTVNSIYAQTGVTSSTEKIDNETVKVSEVIIYPSTNQTLKMHRHDYNRVIVPFDDGTLKITNNKNQVHYLKFEKGKPYYLTKDATGELHKDENISNNPIKVLIIEIK